MFKLNIPVNPIDKFEIKYWELSWADNWYYIKEMKMTYYLNTAWEEYEPNNRGGADLIDDWMISEKSQNGSWNGIGRYCGWESIKDKELGNCFATKEETISEAKNRYNKEITKTKKHIENMIKLRDEL